MLHTSLLCNNLCNAHSDTTPSDDPGGRPDPPPLHLPSVGATPSDLPPGSPSDREAPCLSGRVSHGNAGAGRPLPCLTIIPPGWHLGSLRCHGDARQVWLTHPAHEVSQNQRERGFCGCGRRLPLRGLPDGPTLHEDPPEQGALHHTSS